MEESNNATPQTPPTPQAAPTPPTPQATPTTPPPPTDPIKRTGRFSLKAIISTIIFLLLAGGAAAGYVYREPLMKLVSKPTPTPSPIVTITPTPTASPTAGWKTYHGNGFSFQYPPEWNLSSQAGELIFSKKIREERPTGQTESLPTNTTVSITVKEKEPGENLENWAQNEVERRALDDFQPTVATIIAAGVPAIETEFPSMFGEHLTVFMDSINVYVLKLEWITDDEKFIQQEFKAQILSTFKFSGMLGLQDDINYILPKGWKISESSDESYFAIETIDIDRDEDLWGEPIIKGADIVVTKTTRSPEDADKSLQELILIMNDNEEPPTIVKPLSEKTIQYGKNSYLNRFYNNIFPIDQYYIEKGGSIWQIGFSCNPGCNTKAGTDNSIYSTQRDEFLTSLEFTN